MKAQSEYITKTYDLSTAKAKDSVVSDQNHEQKIKSIKILSTTISSASVFVFFPETNETLTLKPGIPFNFATARSKAVFYWDAQSGAQVEIGFSQKEFFDIGPLEIGTIDNAYVSEGTYNGNSLVTANTSASALIPTLVTASRRTLENISSIPIYVGDQASVAHANYKKLCEVLFRGDLINWNSVSALYGRTETGTATDGLRLKTFSRT